MPSNKQSTQTTYFFYSGQVVQNTTGVTELFINTNATSCSRNAEGTPCVIDEKSVKKEKTNKPWYRKEARKRW